MKSFSFYGGVFCVTSATLMLQLIQTRMLSVVVWYHLAFFVISMAMLGLTAGAVWVYLKGSRFTEKTLSYDLANFSTAFALSTVLGLALQVTLVPTSRFAFTTVVIWLELALVIAAPFFFSGVVVSLALTRSPFPIGRVYGIDLIGAAIGCFGVLVLLNEFNGPTAILCAAALVSLGAVFFANSRVGAAPPRSLSLPRVLSWHRVWFVVLVAVAALNSTDTRRMGFYPIFAKATMQLDVQPWFEKWNSFSRIVATRPALPVSAPQLSGASPVFVPTDVPAPQSVMSIDSDAGTVAYGIEGDLARASFLKSDITNLAYYLPDLKSAAVIGVGGGKDILAARLFGVPKVTGIEVNPTFINLLRPDGLFGPFVGMEKIGGVTLVVDEARSWLARNREHFDVIQMSLIDTWAATGAGAFSLSENGLYTVDAWEIFLRRLTPDGIFTVSRWHAAQDVAETGRLISLAVASLLELGVKEPEKHIFLAWLRLGDEGVGIATLIVSRSAFTAAQLQSLGTAIDQLKFEPLIVPGRKSPSETLDRIVNFKNVADLERFTGSFRLDMTPPTDNRPFFFNQLPFSQVFAIGFTEVPPGVRKGNYLATTTLAGLFLMALLLVLVTIVLPLRNALNDVGQRLAVGGTAYFVLIGVGFMLVEIGLLQRFSVFLGHPTYSLSVVLFSLILAAGIGSLLSDSLRITSPFSFSVWVVITGGYILSQAMWVPSLLLSLDSETLLIRSLVSIAIITPAGLLMGYGFPTGMSFISAVDNRPTPWFWGINGAASVLASATGVACSIAYGIGATLSLGAICYLLLLPAAFVIGFPERTVRSGRNAVAA